MDGQLELHFTIEKEDDQFIASCDELDIASQGHTVEEAMRHVMDAVLLWAEVQMEDGDLERELSQRGLKLKQARTGGVATERFTTVRQLPVC